MQLRHQPEGSLQDVDPWANIPEGPFQFISLGVTGLCLLNLKINSVTENFKKYSNPTSNIHITIHNSLVKNSFVQGTVS
jgi:hypothetical protein